MKYVVGKSLLLFLVVSVAWYWSENYGGRIGRELEGLGQLIVTPGFWVDSVLSGTLGGFGDARDLIIKIGVSFAIWVIPLIIIPEIIKKRSERLQNRCNISNCLSCGYDLTGNKSGRCPECGQLIRK